MEATLKQLHIDKSKWTSVKFGDVAQEPKENAKDLKAEGIEHVVGLEHIETEDIHLRRSANLEESTTFTKKFAEGDVLFGRRRAYLKKAAQASFSGICSGDITVFRAKDEILPELLPFVVCNDKFFDYAVKHSAGGLSPRVKFKDLANYEFLLPPKDQQKQLAELLWAMDDVIEKEKEVLGRLGRTYQTLVDNLFSKKQLDWIYKPVGKIGKINAESLKGKTSPDYEFHYLDIASIIEPKVIGDLKKIKFSEAPSRARRIVKDDSIILSMVRPYQQSFVYVEKAFNIIASTGTGVINVNSGINSKFVFHQFFSKKFIRYCEDRMTGTNYPAITPVDIEQFKIAIPIDDNEINKLTDKLDGLDKNCALVKSKITSSKALQKSLINQIF
jgi:type I restriction enzyme S subunit